MRGSAATQAQKIVDLAGQTIWPVTWQADAWTLARQIAESGKNWGLVATTVQGMAARITEAFYRGPYLPYDPAEKFHRTDEQLAHRRNWRRGKRARCQVKAQRLPRGQR